MKLSKVVVEVRRGMVERVYSDIPNIQILVLDHDGETQGYGVTELEAVELRPLSGLDSGKLS